MQGLVWRLAASFLLGVIWFTFLIIWLFFFASGYSGYQNLALIMVSIVITIGILAAIWLRFGLRFARQVESIELDWKERRTDLGWRGVASIVVWSVWFGFIASWLFFFAGGHDFYQNLAVIIVSMVFAGGASALLWSPFGPR